ncbi:MAG: Rieske 2Fe-2S domain-containing protein [Anaerolineales bacterium]|nr:Rieske 2Fe-2S domain-containing protein [Anaerolineales bacterium]
MNKLSRRDFIKLSTNALFGLSGLLGLGGLLRYLSYLPGPEKPTEFDLGDVANYPVGSRTVRSDIPAVIYNRSGKIVAHSLICTHLGCTIAENGAEFDCPCHGSRFDENGAVLAGPAQKPLQNLRVEILEDGMLKLHTKG